MNTKAQEFLEENGIDYALIKKYYGENTNIALRNTLRNDRCAGNSTIDKLFKLSQLVGAKTSEGKKVTWLDIRKLFSKN